MKKIMFIAPHPDDEILGCGGVMHKFRNKKSCWMIITKMSKRSGYDEKQIKKRDKEINKVSKVLQINSLVNLEFDASFLNKGNLKELIYKMSSYIKKFKPDTIFAPYLHDAHSDHFFSTYALNHILKSFRYPFINKCYLYETLSETNQNFVKKEKFIPNVYFDISKNLNNKLKTIKIYNSEIKKHPFPRSISSIKSLAILRGSESGFRYAESFQLLFEKKK